MKTLALSPYRPAQRSAARAPSLALTSFEAARAAIEYAGMRLMDKSTLPQGDGHPVVLFPGLASDQHAIRPLKEFCQRLGYDAFDWGRGFNTGPKGNPDRWLDALADEVLARVPGHAERISLIGWSLGGIYAREVAKRLGTRARQVITIGTPFAGTSDQTRAGLVYRLLNGGREPVIDQAMQRRLRVAPPVPTTSIYSRTDGVVAWQACIQEGSSPQIENIEVTGSHCGLGWNAEVYRVVADRLRQPHGRWRPYAGH